ncbi:MAG TPA: flagellar motor protein MotB [Bryobacteraceae bacterium]|nr:flagellar motor protein MotB [Bryobacteraceae bacterium]
MKSRYLEKGTPHRDRWMVSYVDVLTILLIFFMVGAAKSLETPPPAHKAAPPPQPIAAPPPKPPATEEPHRENLIRAQEQLREHGLDPRLEDRGLVISLPQVVLFSSGADHVSPQAFGTIAQIAEVLRDIPNPVRLIGHADTTPIHTRRFSNNWELSMARSQKILDLLTSRYGLAESRFSIASYGPYRPAAPNDTADGRASNRRVEIVILDEPAPEK